MESRGAEKAGAQHEGHQAPWQLAAAGAVWLVFGIVLVVLGVGGDGPDGAADEQVSRLTEQLGEDTVAHDNGTGPSPFPLVTGLVMIILTLTLAAGKAWARVALVLSGTVAVVALTPVAWWAVLLAMLLMVCGTMPLMSASLHRYLSIERPQSSRAGGPGA